MKCVNCSYKRLLKGEKRTIKYTECGLDNVILKNIIVYTCPECGEEYFMYGDLHQLHSLIKDLIMKQSGIITGPQIRFLRKYHGYSKEYFASIVGVDERTIYRWESGKNIIKQVDKTVRLAFAYAETDRDYDYHDYLLNKKKGMEFKMVKFTPSKSGFSMQLS